MIRPALLLFALVTSTSALSQSLPTTDHSGRKDDRAEFYDERYALDDLFTKRTDNHGDGFEDLYGTRNFRVILKGIAYRGGANNKWNRDNQRDNRNPLPGDGLLSLCEEGFDQSYYLYSTNYESAPRVTQCESLRKETQVLDYQQASPFDEEHTHEILKTVFETINNEQDGPIYLHCWNGWHASGLIAAKILRQFCGMSADEAVQYWDKNTDGHNQEPRYESIRTRIRDFAPYPELSISDEQAAMICP